MPVPLQLLKPLGPGDLTRGCGGKPASASRGTKLAVAGKPADIAGMGESSAAPLTAASESAVAETMTKGFKPVQFAWGQILCRGGQNNKPLPITTLKIMIQGQPHQFCKMSTKEPWLCKAVTGHTCPQRTSISRASLLSDLLAKVKDAADGNGDSVNADVAADPMNAVEGGVPPPQAKKQRRNWRATTNKVRNTCIVLDFPSKCPEMHPECTDTRSITLYVKDRLQIWLDIEDVPWAVEYMYDQNFLKGVAAVHPEDTGPDGAAPATPTHVPASDFADKLDPSAEVHGMPAAVLADEERNCVAEEVPGVPAAVLTEEEVN